MNKILPQEKIDNIIKFQRNYRFLKSELNNLSTEVIFLKECLVDMSNNLITLHKLKLYEGVNNGYSVIFNELNQIKNKLADIPDIIRFNYINKKNINTVSKDIYDCRSNIIKYMSHIGMQDIRMMLRILLGSNWNYHFSYNDLVRIDLMARLFNPITCWDSSIHKEKVPYMKQDIPKRQQFTQENINNIVENNIKTTAIAISDINAFPLFLKSLTDIVLKDKKITKPDRKIDFDHMDMLGMFKTSDNVIFIKNTFSTTLLEDKCGFIILIHINERVIVIPGFAKDDMLELYKTNNIISEKIMQIKKYVSYEIVTVPKLFKNNFSEILSLRDILIMNVEEIGIIIKKRYNDYKSLRNKYLTNLINDFLLASKFRKQEIIILFLCGNDTDIKLAYLLYDILKIKDKKDIASDIYNSLPTKFKIKLDETEGIMAEEEEKLLKSNMSELSYERRINMLNVSQDIKDKAIEKLKAMKTNIQGDGKAQSWLDGFLKIPFGNYRENKLMNFKKEFIKRIDNSMALSPMTFDSITKYVLNKNDLEMQEEWIKYSTDRSTYLKKVHENLDKAVYGHKEAKLQLERLFAQWINGETKGAIIGLWGPPGTGKTSLAKNGLSKCLIDDDGKPRPFAFLPIGGSVNGSTLVGHNFTYVGSTWGRIADITMTSGCMNPIIFIDEVDKISNTEYGKEIVSVLTHLTDATQNDNFEDKYFSGIPLDLSKALIVFSFNDITLLDPILKDRITIIETKPYTLQEKIHIIIKYMLPEVLLDVGYNDEEIKFTDDIITYIINSFTNEAGVRKVKEKIVEIVRDINLKAIHDPTMIFPFIVTQEYVDDLFRNKPKMKPDKIHKEPEVGMVNGLYATTSGVGGLTVIQVMKYPSDKMLELTITGQQGEVMKESAIYALRIAYNMLPDDIKNKIIDDANNKKNFGLLVHAPDAATKKDGPSAGTAMTLALYSALTGKKIDNTVAMTGEIDLWKNVKKIGGLHAKLTGAKMAGVKKALIPMENLEDLNILRNDNISPEDENFIIETVDTFEDVLKYCIIK